MIRAVLFSIALASSMSVLAAQPAPSLSAYLQSKRMAVAIEQGKLSGAGADSLVEAARAAPFILVGEDHGFADVPQFVVALDRSLGNDASNVLVLEIGPMAAERLRRAHDRGDISAVARTFPGSAAFVEWQDDLNMVSHWLDAGKPLVGVDQEFVLSARANLIRLQALAPAAGRPVIDTALNAATEAEQTMFKTGDLGLAHLLHLQEADFASWREAFAQAPNAEAQRIIDALADSAQIYAWNNTDPQRSNRERSRLMKREFMAAYRSQAGVTEQRWMFRMGAYHVGRGLSPTGQYDLGNLVSELAESQGKSSLHLLVLAAGGQVNRRLPVMSDLSLESQPYDAPAELDSVTGKVFLEAVKDQRGWAVYDLRPLRANRALREQGGATFANLVFAYDFIVMIDQAKAARSVAIPAKRAEAADSPGINTP